MLFYKKVDNIFSFIKKHYHWVIAFVMLLQLAAVGGLGNNYTGLFIMPITEDLGISRASFSLAFTLKYLFSFITMLLSGMLIMRFGNKKPMVAGLLFCGAGYAILPLSTTTWMLAAGNILLGIGDALCCTAAVSRIISAWFHKYQGLVWGTVSASTGFGGSIVCVFLSGIIQKYGWRTAYFTSSVMILITLVLVILFVKGQPEQMGLKPYGLGFSTKMKRIKSENHWAGYDKNELFRQPIFYLALISVLFAAFAIYLAFDIIVPHLQHQGLTTNEAVAQQSAMLIYLTISKFLSGLLSDWLGAKPVTIGCTLLGSISLLLLALVGNVGSATVAIIFYAFCLPLPTVLIPLLTCKLFGYRAQGTHHGIFMSIPQLALLIAAPVSNTIFDLMGSYKPALIIASGLALVSTVLFVITSIISKRARHTAITE